MGRARQAAAGSPVSCGWLAAETLGQRWLMMFRSMVWCQIAVSLVVGEPGFADCPRWLHRAV